MMKALREELSQGPKMITAKDETRKRRGRVATDAQDDGVEVFWSDITSEESQLTGAADDRDEGSQLGYLQQVRHKIHTARQKRRKIDLLDGSSALQ